MKNLTDFRKTVETGVDRDWMMRFEDITADPCRVKWANRGTG